MKNEMKRGGVPRELRAIKRLRQRRKRSKCTVHDDDNIGRDQETNRGPRNPLPMLSKDGIDIAHPELDRELTGDVYPVVGKSRDGIGMSTSTTPSLSSTDNLTWLSENWR